LVDRFKEMVCKVGGDAHERLDTRERHQYNGSLSLEFLDHFKVRDACRGVLAMPVLFE
jgi:hypothetical protein